MRFASINKTSEKTLDCFVCFGVNVFEKAVNFTIGKIKWEADNLTAAEVEEVVVNIYDAETEVLVSEVVLKRSPVSSGKFIFVDGSYGMNLAAKLNEYERKNY